MKRLTAFLLILAILAGVLSAAAVQTSAAFMPLAPENEIKLPFEENPMNPEYRFVGWTDEEIEGETETAPTIYVAGSYVEEDLAETLIPLYARVTSGYERTSENREDWTGFILLGAPLGRDRIRVLNASLENLNEESNCATIVTVHLNTITAQAGRNYSMFVAPFDAGYALLTPLGSYFRHDPKNEYGCVQLQEMYDIYDNEKSVARYTTIAMDENGTYLSTDDDRELLKYYSGNGHFSYANASDGNFNYSIYYASAAYATTVPDADNTPIPDAAYGRVSKDVWQDIFGFVGERKRSFATEESCVAILDDLTELITASDTYEEGSLTREGNTLYWWTKDGIRCSFDPEMQAQIAKEGERTAALVSAIVQAEEKLYDEQSKADENTETAATASSPALKNGHPQGSGVSVFEPFYGYHPWHGGFRVKIGFFNYTLVPDLDEKTSYAKIGEELARNVYGDTFFYRRYRGNGNIQASTGSDYAWQSSHASEAVTVDRIVNSICYDDVVIIHTHGYSTGLCLTSWKGITYADMLLGASYSEDNVGTTAYPVDNRGLSCPIIKVTGEVLVNHMGTRRAPHNLVWLSACSCMQSNRISNALRNKGVEVVFSFSRTSYDNASGYDLVSYYGANSKYTGRFFLEIGKGATVAQAAQAMKSDLGYWEEPVDDSEVVSAILTGTYDEILFGQKTGAQNLITAIGNERPFPIFTSSEDPFPGTPTSNYSLNYNQVNFTSDDPVMAVNNWLQTVHSNWHMTGPNLPTKSVTAGTIGSEHGMVMAINEYTIITKPAAGYIPRIKTAYQMDANDNPVIGPNGLTIELKPEEYGEHLGDFDGKYVDLTYYRDNVIEVHPTTHCMYLVEFVKVADFAAPTGYYSNVNDYFAAAQITVSGAKPGPQFAAGSTFTVKSAIACYVGISFDGGATYTELAATKTAEDNTYSFTLPALTGDFTIGIALRGDATGDGKVEATDALRIQRYATNDPDEPYESNFETEGLALLAADTTGDGKVNSMDALRIQRFVTNDPEEPFPEGTYEILWNEE